jgi:flagellar basal-body rod modification protein FlgD
LVGIMEITPTQNIASQTPTGSSQAEANLNYDSFLKLLIAQMKNQDPTKPMDSSQYIAQLATFSNVEQAIKTNAKLDTLMTSMALSQAEGIIGRNVTSADGMLSGEVVAMRVVTGGAVAVLQNGHEIPLGPGVIVS